MKNLAEDVFGCPKEKVLDKVVVTNHVRCSTEIDFGNIKKDIRLKIGTTCVEKHLIDEINYWKPKMIVVCGTPARETLDELREIGLLNFNYEKTYHPSLHFQDKIRTEQFIEIGKKLNHLK